MVWSSFRLSLGCSFSFEVRIDRVYQQRDVLPLLVAAVGEGALEMFGLCDLESSVAVGMLRVFAESLEADFSGM